MKKELCSECADIFQKAMEPYVAQALRDLDASRDEAWYWKNKFFAEKTATQRLVRQQPRCECQANELIRSRFSDRRPVYLRKIPEA